MMDMGDMDNKHLYYGIIYISVHTNRKYDGISHTKSSSAPVKKILYSTVRMRGCTSDISESMRFFVSLNYFFKVLGNRALRQSGNEQ